MLFESEANRLTYAEYTKTNSLNLEIVVATTGLYTARGTFNKGVDLLHVCEELRMASQAEGKNPSSFIRLFSDLLSDMVFTFDKDKSETIYITETSGTFLLNGFVSCDRIIDILQDVRYFVEKQ